MININLTNKDIAMDNTSLFQWDYGQKLAISGLSVTENIQVHFARSGQKAEIKLGTISDNVVIVDIPDALLQKSGMINAYIYLSDTESGETIKIINLNVREREQPTDYTSPDYVDVVAELNTKLNRIIETGIAQYEPDPTLVDTLVTQKLNAVLGSMATKNEVAKTDLTAALVEEINGKLNASKMVTNLAVTEYGFIPDAKTVSDSVNTLNSNLAAVDCIISSVLSGSDIGNISAKKKNNRVILNMLIRATLPQPTAICVIDQKPSTSVYFTISATNDNVTYFTMGAYIDTDGNLGINIPPSLANLSIYYYISVSYDT